MNTPLSTGDPAFLNKISGWLEQRDELLVLLRYPRAAGAKDFYFVQSGEQFEQLIHTLPPQTSVIVFRDPQPAVARDRRRGVRPGGPAGAP